jgi:hypothetical protein
MRDSLFIKSPPRWFILIFSLLIFTVACSNITFQPSRKFFYEPKSFGLTYSDIYLESEDGTMLHGWFFPAAKGVEEEGIIIQFHGNAENISTHFFSLAWMTRHNYNLFIFDYRGYGKSEGSPSHAKVNDDALAALEYAVNMKRDHIEQLESKGEEIHDFKLVAYGQSLGGTTLLRALDDFKLKSALDAVIVESSFPSYQEIAREKLSLSFITWPFQPLAYILFSDKYAPKRTIADISPIPLLVIHGSNDFIVPYHHGEKIYNLAKDPKWLWKVEGGKHINAMRSHEYRSKLLHFLKELDTND